MTTYQHLQEKIKELDTSSNITDYLMGFLLAYEIPRATLVRMRVAEGINADTPIKVGNKLLVSYTLNENLYTYYDHVQRNFIKNQSYRLVMLLNKKNILAYDSQTGDWLYIERTELYKDCDFFYPLIGMERNVLREQENANIKIGEKIARLYNELIMLNQDAEEVIAKFIVDLVFCVLADSFEIVPKGSIYSWVDHFTNRDGDNISRLFNEISNELTGNAGRLLEQKTSIGDGFLHLSLEELKFDGSSRNILLEICSANWAEVEPEVLGAMIQSIVVPSDNAVSYNYTSTANIYKVIGPLFMDDLYSEYEHAKKKGELSVSYLEKLAKIKILDPNCGAGNFLMVTLRELETLEKNVKKSLREEGKTFEEKEYVGLHQFYGIEQKSIAVDMTRIGMAFTDYKYGCGKMHNEFCDHIVNAFPLDVEWEEICSKKDAVVYIIGNPTYLGARPLRQERRLLNSFNKVFANERTMRLGDLDLATAWMYLATVYTAGTEGGFAFVTTNSLTQGKHVPDLWPTLFNKGICISFAYTRFKWKNEGRNNTAVTVVILGCRAKENPHRKTIYDGNKIYDADNISPYLHKGSTIVKEERNSPICSWMPKMRKGNMAAECCPRGEHTLFLGASEKNEILSLYPEAVKVLRRAVGSDEYVNGIERWCLWIDDEDLQFAMEIPFIEERIELTRKYRLESPSSQHLAERPHQFRERYMPQKYTLVVPAVTGENGGYFQIGYVGKNVVVTNLVFAIYDAEPWVFGLLSSKMHHIWACTVCGGLETRPRYSNILGYNTFPVPELSDDQKQSISEAAMGVIVEREKYSEMTMAEMYNYDTMPTSLKSAHMILDEVVEQCYGKFYSDQERLDTMFQLYETIKGV